MPTDEVREYLKHLQDREFQLHVPALVFLAIFAVLGLVGNTLVLLVYQFKRQKSSTRIFIMVIAMVDLLANVFCMPGEMYEMFHLWDGIPALCQLFRYANTSTTITSVFLLLAVAVTRFREICRPFQRQVTRTKAKIICVCIFIFGWTVAVPNGIVSGSHVRLTPLPGIVGHVCSIAADSYIDTIWPLVNHVVFLSIFLCAAIPMIVLYCLIGVKACRHRESPDDKLKASNNTSNSVAPEQTETNTCTAAHSNRKSVFAGLLKGKFEKGRIADGTSTVRGSDSKDSSEIKKKPERKEKKTKGDNRVRMIRSPISDDESKINFSMVHELTVKLNRFKSQDDSSGQDKNGSCETSALSEEKEETDSVNHSMQPDNCNGTIEEIKDDPKTMGPESIRETDATDTTCPEISAEPQSGLASRLQWIDITYCLYEDDSEDTTPVKTDKESASKKSSRKVSRESSLVQRQKNFREQLMNTLSKRRGTKKDDALIVAKENGESGISLRKKSGSGAGEDVEDQRKYNTNESCRTPASGLEDKELVIRNNRSHKKRVDSDNNNTYNSTDNSNDPNHIGVSKTTRMFIVITFIFIVSYIPHFLLVLYRFLHPENFQAMGTPSLITHHLFLRLYYLNSAINPIIYSLYDVKFRRDVFRVFMCSKLRS